VLPSMTPLLVELLGKGSSTAAVVSFPSGSDSTRLKVAQARELVEMGCTEIDMVVNIGKLLSLRDDIRAVVEAVRPLPVKVILECHYLSDEQILAGCDLAVEGGAAFVKTGTGWAETGATLENVTLIKAGLGERAGIKAAGGVRGLETLLEMARRGVSRFGLGWRTATEILNRVRSF
ncbi:MAG TPA: deoxyribose-phosphate aldolase, partial [Anaerolineales bacterium]|nr:deoxyribose-phosphate aldolase [Anaerolineales bacterium]